MQLEIVVGKFGWSELVGLGRRIAELQVCVVGNEIEQRAEGEVGQSIMSVIAHVRHVNIDGIVEDRLEQFSSLNAPHKLAKSAWILSPEDCVSVKAASLSWQYLNSWRFVCAC